MQSSLRIDRRFCGPAESGNGGYVCGRIAELIPGPAEVTLRAPPPLEQALQVVRAPEGRIELLHDCSLIAEGKPASVSVELPEPVSLEQARLASQAFIGFAQHPYPTCFVCGTQRPLDDGLRLHAGAVASRALVAAPWTPAADLARADELVEPRFVWCALDCPSWFGHASFLQSVPRILLGRLAVQIDELPRAGEPHVVLGWSIRAEGRRITCGSALQDAQGRFLAHAVATWITLRDQA